jgi:hypothetical protein
MRYGLRRRAVCEPINLWEQCAAVSDAAQR